MKGYWIVKANTVNADKQKDYASLASKAVEKYKDINDFSKNANDDEILDLNKSISIVADKLGVSEDAGGNGYRLITNAGKDSHQEVPHLHFHLVAGKPLGPLLVK